MPFKYINKNGVNLFEIHFHGRLQLPDVKVALSNLLRRVPGQSTMNLLINFKKCKLYKHDYSYLDIDEEMAKFISLRDEIFSDKAGKTAVVVEDQILTAIAMLYKYHFMTGHRDYEVFSTTPAAIDWLGTAELNSPGFI